LVYRLPKRLDAIGKSIDDEVLGFCFGDAARASATMADVEFRQQQSSNKSTIRCNIKTAAVTHLDGFQSANLKNNYVANLRH
jgi:hypothetical protein